MDLLRLTTKEQSGWTVVTAVGQLDVATAPDLRQLLVEVQHNRGQRVAVDLDGVEFLDSMGLGVLVGGQKRARSHGGSLVLVCSRERLLQLFVLTGLDRVFTIVDNLEQVLRGAS